MLVIRRMVTRRGGFTVMLLPPDIERIFPTTEQEHNRILNIYKQDRPDPAICNDFSDYLIGINAPEKAPD
jgi:hypothetical protein